MPPPTLSAYILAGGRSSRMGSDKALLPLAGKPLIAHAVTKLRRLAPQVHILSANSALAPYGPLVRDLHPGTGPIGGIEAALTHTSTDWNLIYPVDVPLLPTALLDWWQNTVLQQKPYPPRIALFQLDAIPQPALLLIHRAALPILTAAISRGAYKLFPALESAARQLAPPDATPNKSVPYLLPIDEHFHFETPPLPPGAVLEPWQILTGAQRAAHLLWFANLNSPGDLTAVQLHLDALDT